MFKIIFLLNIKKKDGQMDTALLYGRRRSKCVKKFEFSDI